MIAHTVPLESDLDLNDVARGDGYLFVREGVGFAGRGVAARVPVDEAVEFLAAIEHDDEVGDTHGPIALGALPFLPGAPATLVVPAVVVGKDAGGRAWMTRIDGADDPLVDDHEPVPMAASYTLRPLVDVDHYLNAVAVARDAVRDGRMEKAVIARPIAVDSDQPIDVHAVLRRLKATFGSSHRFSIDGFIGASPELLVEVDGDIVRSFPLAGTTRTTGDPELDAKLAAELQASPKNQIEHRVAIEMVRDTLLPYCSYLDWAPEPEIVKVANVQHLGSQAEGRLSHPVPTVIELVRGAATDAGRRWLSTRRGDRSDHVRRRLRARPVRRRGGLGRRTRQRPLGGVAALRRVVRGPPQRAIGGRRRHRRRQRSEERAVRDASQIPSNAERDREAVAACR